MKCNLKKFELDDTNAKFLSIQRFKCQDSFNVKGTFKTIGQCPKIKFTTINIYYIQQYLLIRQFETFLGWNVIILILGIGKFCKILEACQKQCHCFVIACTPEQVDWTKPAKSIPLIMSQYTSLEKKNSKGRRFVKLFCSQLFIELKNQPQSHPLYIT